MIGYFLKPVKASCGRRIVPNSAGPDVATDSHPLAVVETRLKCVA